MINRYHKLNHADVTYQVTNTLSQVDHTSIRITPIEGTQLVCDSVKSQTSARVATRTCEFSRNRLVHVVHRNRRGFKSSHWHKPQTTNHLYPVLGNGELFYKHNKKITHLTSSPVMFFKCELHCVRTLMDKSIKCRQQSFTKYQYHKWLTIRNLVKCIL